MKGIKNYITAGELRNFLEGIPKSWRINFDVNPENGQKTLSAIWWGDEPKKDPGPGRRDEWITVSFPTSDCQRCGKVEIPSSWGYCDKCESEMKMEEERDKEALKIGRASMKKAGILNE